MQVLSAIPGRVRWHVPLLRDRDGLSRAVVADLLARPHVRSANANPLTATVLVTFPPQTPIAEAEAWVMDALERGLDAPALPAPVNGELTATGQTPMNRLMTRVAEHRGLLATMMSSSLAVRLLDSSPPLLIGTGIDIVTKRGVATWLARLGFRTVRSQLFALGGLGFAVWGANALLDYVHRRSAAELANRVRNDLRNELYEHLQRLDLAQVEALDVSEWMNLLEGHLSRIHSFIREGSDPMMTMTAASLAVGASVLTMSPRFALVQLLVLPPVAVVSHELIGPLKDRLMLAQRDADRLSALLHGNVSSLATINSFATQDMEAQRVADSAGVATASASRADEIHAAYVPMLKAIVGTGFTGTLVWGGLLVADGELAPGAYNVLASSQLRLLAAVGHLGSSAEAYQRATVSMKKVFRILDMQPRIVSPAEPVPFKAPERALSLDHVTFGYDADRSILRNLTMRFPAGKTTGIVGATGAGKSTILKLLVRFYDVDSGSVRYDDVDVRDLRLEDLRSASALVSQDVAIFAGSVRDNIAYARPGASDDEIRRAAEIAEAHEFISRLPQGYATEIGFRGLSLSTGQRQRLAIARVVLADRPILLFDEATSALDFRTEAAVQRSLHDVTEGRTTIIVAHRLSTVRNADLIYVLDEGRVQESGVHDELVALDGIYAAMWRVQTGTALRRRSGNGA
jgi:ATP-binding cassette subfamily B protein